jgi:outer membrane protein OmpA-like peptidoglycan-associated protein
MSAKINNRKSHNKVMKHKEAKPALQETSEWARAASSERLQSAVAAPKRATSSDVPVFQHKIGNRATTRLIQASHPVNASDQEIEPKANRVGAQKLAGTAGQLIQRTIDPDYPVTNGEFHVNATPQNAPSGSTRASLPITIEFEPNTTAPYSNQIGLIQIVRDINSDTGDNVEPQSLPAARGVDLRTQSTDAPGVEAGYFTDVLHNDAPSASGTGTDAPEGSSLPPQYPFGHDAAQPNPTTPGLSRPFSSGASGATVGYKRSDDPADIKSAELTDAPGSSGNRNFDFETVAKGEDTNTIYGALKWGFEIRSGAIQNDQASVDDSQSATFDAALERHREFYVHEPVIFYFDFDRDTLNAGEAAKIDTFIAYLTRNPDVQVTVTGYADLRGDPDYNLDLSLRRAEAVAGGLRDRGIPQSQINNITIGSGETDVFTEDATTDQDRDANRRGNRRVVLTFEHIP